MHENITTAVGHVATPLRSTSTDGGTMASFRMASTVRRWDRLKGGWADGVTNFYTVLCYRQLADNVLHSLHRGEPIVVHGWLKQREWTNDQGARQVSHELEAYAIGHDLSRGTTSFVKMRPPGVVAIENREAAAESLARELHADERAERTALASVTTIGTDGPGDEHGGERAERADGEIAGDRVPV